MDFLLLAYFGSSVIFFMTFSTYIFAEKKDSSSWSTKESMHLQRFKLQDYMLIRIAIMTWVLVESIFRFRSFAKN